MTTLKQAREVKERIKDASRGDDIAVGIDGNKTIGYGVTVRYSGKKPCIDPVIDGVRVTVKRQYHIRALKGGTM